MNIHRYAESSTQSSLHDQVQCSEPHVLRRKILMKTRIYIVGWLEEVCAQGTLSMQPLTFNHSSKATEHLVYVCMWVIAGWCFRVSNTKTVRNNWENRLLLFRICLRDLMRLISSTIFLQRFQSKSKPYMYLRYIQLNPSKLQSWQKTNTTYTQTEQQQYPKLFFTNCPHHPSTPPTSWNHVFVQQIRYQADTGNTILWCSKGIQVECCGANGTFQGAVVEKQWDPYGWKKSH